MAYKILSMSTNGRGLRSSTEGISAEDGDLIKSDKEIGYSDSMRVTFYKTPMHAIADGWKLLAPPQFEEEIPAEKLASGKSVQIYGWWFVKD